MPKSDRDLARETPDLVPAETLEGAPVFGPDDDPLGRIEALMIEKSSGRVAYAVLAFQGVIDAGEKRCPIPWSALVWDGARKGARISATREQIEGAPAYEPGREPRWDDPAYGSGVEGYWGVAGPARSPIL